MSYVAADPYRFWFNPPVRISNNSTGAVTKRLILRIGCPDLAGCGDSVLFGAEV
jgi:hypothetical protein